MTELMIPVTKVIGLIDRWNREAKGTDGGYWDAKQDCINDLIVLSQDTTPSVAEGVEQIRQQLLASGVAESVAGELAVMQQCLSVLAGMEGLKAKVRVLDWVKGRVESDVAAATNAQLEAARAERASWLAELKGGGSE